MGHKSKFTFPMPGRSSKQPPTVTVSNPLSKADKILGTGGMSLGSPTAPRDGGRSWETGSTGGISISISESSASQSSVLEGDEDGFAGTTYGRALWEEESEALPRRLRSANGPSSKKGLKTKRSAVTLGTRSRDNMTDESLSRRPQSSSTVYSHYESTKVPLSISQQTSNSAMAKGLPSKASTLLDIDGALYGPVQQQKKKPSKLDFSKLRLRSRKDHHASDSNKVGPVLGNNYVMRSPSVMSHMSHTLASPTSPEQTPRPRPDMKLQPQPPPRISGRPGRLKGTHDANTLHQLYDHYEQMSFRHGTDLVEEDEEDCDDVIRKRELLEQPQLLPRTYEPAASDMSREDMITPLPNSIHRDLNSRWNHSRNTSQASKVTATRTGTPNTLQIRPTSRSDYPASVSSRHTRTSKATPSIMSTLDSDRQQQSVLSLTDSDSDEEGTTYSRPGSSLPSYENSFRDDLSVSSSQRQPELSSRLSISSHSTSVKGASYAQLNDYLTIPHASPKAKTSRSPSSGTLQSTSSSISTATRISIPCQQDLRGSVSTTGSVLSPAYSNRTSYGVQEARAVALTPFASTAAAASATSVDRMLQNMNHIPPQQIRQRASQTSHTSDQPTPPLSPSSVEFYKKSPEPTRQEPPPPCKSSESHNARLMAVTKQEEMLLAALRKKRARMRENILAEIEEDRGSRESDAIAEDLEKLASANLKDAERQAAKEVKEAREAYARSKQQNQPNHYPRRSSSLAGRNQRSVSGHSRTRDRSNGPRGMDGPPQTSHSEPTEKAHHKTRISSEHESRRTGKTRHERVLLYLDRPIDSIDVIDQAEPSPDLSEFMEDDLDFPMHGRQSRTRSKLGGSQPTFYNRESTGRPRPDSSPISPKSSPVKIMPNIEPEVNEDIDADDFDFDAFPEPANSRRKLPALKPVPEVEVPRPDSPISPADGFLAPSTLGHKKGKKSNVRLSAVGQISSPVPWWGDDD
ncbi:uncharacterized protein F4822DRAFT_276156 [Hypoxylon trugodes]|uniref:uncharacterized protein n=1 Tax=Hypoxylon trugodes TaxID=326681 RepID=UPI00219226F3|nr:uncharacterized protein F4822DRAFT_276156 [Hypoxylon trugodes]KAI1387186.1 hypothetical protein F4822DRAFT_276156 [Hypoxylon trugodes]